MAKALENPGLLAFYRVKDHIPILALSFAPFLSLGIFSQRAISLFLFDLVLTFLALSFAYSLNDFFDAKISGEKNAAGAFSKKKGSLLSFFLAISPGIISAILGIFFLPAISRQFLLLFLLAFFLYSAPFPRTRNVPGLDLVFNAGGFYLLFAKSYFLHYSSASSPFFLSFSVFLISFYALSEAVHELAHEKEDRRLGRATLFSILGREGATYLAAALVFVPIVFFTGPHSVVSIVFSALRFVAIAGKADASTLRNRLYGREELLTHVLLEAFFG